MTNREYFEKCAGISLSDEFFEWNDIDPNEECVVYDGDLEEE